MPRVWLLNLDVERELEQGAAYQPSARAERAVAQALPGIEGQLLGDEDQLLEEGQRFDGARGWAWCPTERACRLLRQAGARPPASPGDAVLARANQRELALELEQELGLDFGKRLVVRFEELEELLAAHPTQPFLVRRRFGAAGRGSRRFGGRGASLEQEDPGLTWLRAGWRLGPLVVEPWVQVEVEFACHGWLSQGTGELEVGQPCVQEVRGQGTWSASRLARAGELRPEEEAQLLAALEGAGRALQGLGYFGPFGVDGFRYRSGPGERRGLQPLGEVNARFSMGWALGMGSERRDRCLSQA